MRDVKILIIAMISIFFLCGTATAVPQYYLFNGVIRSIEGDNKAIAADQGFKVGQDVEYLFMLDSYVMGQVIYADGKTEYEASDIFAELVSGNPLKKVDGGYYLANKTAAVKNEGSAFITRELHLANMQLDTQNQIFIGNDDESIMLNSSEDDNWKGYLKAYDSNGGKAVVYLDLKLTSITNELPFAYQQEASLAVSEPILMLLLGMGLLLGTSFVHRRKKIRHQESLNPHGVFSVSEH